MEKSEEITRLSEERSSSPTECAICLEQLIDKSFTDKCAHMFCFHCLLAWSKIKSECPLCKQNFRSIIHNIRSVDDYDEYHVTTGISLLSMLAFPDGPSSFFPGEHNISDRRYYSQRTTYVGNEFNFPHVTSSDLVIQPYVDNLEIQREYLPIHYSSPYIVTEKRKEIYLRKLYTIPPAVVFGSRYRECTPNFYRENEDQLHRLKIWLYRELVVLSQIGLTFDISEVLRMIMDMLPVYSIHSTVFKNVAHRYLGMHTSRFIQEFYNFAISPYEIERYDRDSFTRQQNSSHFPFIVDVDEDENEDVQMMSNAFINTSDSPPATLPLLNSNIFTETSRVLYNHDNSSNSCQCAVSNQIFNPLNVNYCQPSTSFNHNTSQPIICISDSEIDDVLDDCLILDNVNIHPETIVLNDSDDEISHDFYVSRQVPSEVIDISNSQGEENETSSSLDPNFIDKHFPAVTAFVNDCSINNSSNLIPYGTSENCKRELQLSKTSQTMPVKSKKKKKLKRHKQEHTTPIYPKKKINKSNSSSSEISAIILSDDDTSYTHSNVYCARSCSRSKRSTSSKFALNVKKCSNYVRNNDSDKNIINDGCNSSVILTDSGEDDMINVDWMVKVVAPKRCHVTEVNLTFCEKGTNRFPMLTETQ